MPNMRKHPAQNTNQETSNILLRLKRPALLLDESKCRKNIAFMASKAQRHNLILRPHFKTHQSAVIGEWMRKEGTEKITVSSVTMGRYFADSGWDDICIAFPFNIPEMNEANELAGRITLHLTVCSARTLELLEQGIQHKAGIYIKTDTGYGRTGIDHEDTKEIGSMLRILEKSSNLRFSGFMVHNGHTYRCRNRSDIERLHTDSNRKLVKLKEKYINYHPDMIISTGDTPSCSVSENFEGVDEIRPGNYVFYDLAQCHIGSCSPENVAIALAAPVVAKHSRRNEIVVYGGAVHLSKEELVPEEGPGIYGNVVEICSDGTWSDPVPHAAVTRISQEHGIIKCEEGFFRRISVGDFVGILPVHSCLTADLMGGYLSAGGEPVDHLSGQKLPGM